jgi:hypothetical protein
MAFKLKKNEVETLVDKIMELRDAENTIEEAIADYNVKLAQTKVFIEARTSAWQTEYDDKSEAWQEGDKGVAVGEFIESYDAFLQDYDELALDGTTGAADALEALDHEVSE